jgi:hypothetical protein
LALLARALVVGIIGYVSSTFHFGLDDSVYASSAIVSFLTFFNYLAIRRQKR